MNDTDTLRYRNARTLIYTVGSMQKIAELVGLSEPQLQKYIGLKPERPIDDGLARKLESAARKPAGWLDREQSPLTPQSTI